MSWQVTTTRKASTDPAFIVKMCRIDPWTSTTTDPPTAGVVWVAWVDEFGPVNLLPPARATYSRLVGRGPSKLCRDRALHPCDHQCLDKTPVGVIRGVVLEVGLDADGDVGPGDAD